jgi:hypothetical protein
MQRWAENNAKAVCNATTDLCAIGKSVEFVTWQEILRRKRHGFHRMFHVEHHGDRSVPQCSTWNTPVTLGFAAELRWGPVRTMDGTPQLSHLCGAARVEPCQTGALGARQQAIRSTITKLIRSTGDSHQVSKVRVRAPTQEKCPTQLVRMCSCGTELALWDLGTD